jgi:hypothetical protein
MDYIQKQQQLQNKANDILNDLGLISFLDKKGEVNLVGSYALNLMSWEDIDIVVNGNQNVDDYLETVNYLFKQPKVYSLNVQDFRKSIFPDRPQGLYCGVSYLVKPNIFWKIDIWFMGLIDKTALELVNKTKSKLNDKNRETILKIKNEMREQGWGKTISGKDVYVAVLEKNIVDTEQFKDYLLKEGRQL